MITAVMINVIIMLGIMIMIILLMIIKTTRTTRSIIIIKQVQYILNQPNGKCMGRVNDSFTDSNFVILLEQVINKCVSSKVTSLPTC